MAIQTVFQRYELKYLLSPAQKQQVLDGMLDYMKLDEYGRTTIRNLYYDTDNYRLVRHSIEKPMYKEKLRIRSYSQVKYNDRVFIELKKKYEHIVYKRRVSMPESDAIAWIDEKKPVKKQTQITNEIDYFLSYYETLSPVVFLSYEREAFRPLDNSGFRVTFDENILARQSELSLEASVYGTPLISPESTLMELKCPGAIPLWMVKILSENHIYKTSFSKYGKAYESVIYPNLHSITPIISKEELLHA